MVPYSGLAKPVSTCLLADVSVRLIREIGSFMIPPPLSVRGILAADAKAPKESADNKKVATVINL